MAPEAESPRSAWTSRPLIRTRATFTFNFDTFALKRVTVYVARNGTVHEFILTYSGGDPAAPQFLAEFQALLDSVHFQ
jgi:organic radical activating enzyme